MEDNHNYFSDEDIAAFIDGNVSYPEAERILASLKDDPEITEILALSPRVDLAVAQDNDRLLPMSALAAANPHNLCSFECEAFVLRQLGFNIDRWSLLEEAKANNWVREQGTPLHLVGKLLELKGLYVKRKYDASFADLRKALESGNRLIAVIDKNIIDDIDEPMPPSFHALCITSVEVSEIKYLNLHNLSVQTLDNGTFNKAWHASGHYMVSASNIPGGYNPQPINVDDISLDADLEELTEAIAENAHDIWARTRMDEGWTYGPVRDDARKLHPDLVPYAQLPDSEKKYDRLMAMNTLRLVQRLGFRISNQNII